MRRALFALLALLACAHVVEAAVVHLKDGGRISGTVVSATARDIQLHTPDGLLNISSDRISRVDYEDAASSGPPVPSRLNDGGQASLQDGPDKDFFSLGLGFGVPVSRVDFSAAGGGSADNGDSGLSLGIQYGHMLTSRLSVGMNVEYLGRGGTGSQSLVPEANTDVSGNSLLLLATAKYSILDRGGIRPYLLGGIGANRTSTIIDATPNPGFGWSDTSTAETRTLVDDSRWGLASTVRVGLDFMLIDPAFFSLEFGWNGIHNPDAQATQAGKDLGLENVTGELSALTLAARWGWRF